jgi:tetratricopeptide (TPR) repeat protein
VPCPSAAELACYTLRVLSPDDTARVQTHVDACGDCRAASSAVVTISRSDELASGDGARGWTGARLAPGATLDRYVILHELGEGAASVVYAAYDPELDRKVALKLLRSRGADVDDRLLREGRALARLSHPNIVTVYEVGGAGEQLYIALELVEGVTARQWAAVAPRTWRAVRDVHAAAGRGLAALHAAGLVHRDVKPDNIVVAADGRVRLVDLGLVGAGAGAGTPAYMAPELRDGDARGDAASDQYALAASLAEALAGASDGVVGAPPLARIAELAAPRKVRAALARALATTPGARFASVDAFLAELADRPRWQIAVPAAVVVGAAASAAIVLGLGRGEDTARCADAGAAMYPPALEAKVIDAIATSDRPHAAATGERVVPKLASTAREWRTARTAVCTAYHERHAISAERFDREVACLERQRAGLEAAAAHIGGGGGDAIDHAITLVAALPAVDECKDEAALARTEPLPPEAGKRGAIAAVEAALTSAEVAQRAGDAAGALATAERALADARAAGYRPALARATYIVADLLDRAGEDGAGERTDALLDEAIRVAAEARFDEIEARAWILRLYRLGVVGQASATELGAATSAGEAAAARAGDPLTRARLGNVLGLVAKVHGDYATARDRLTAALALVESAAPDGAEVASTLANLSGVLPMLGDLAGARAAAEQAAARDLAMFGPDHPSYADSLVQLASREIELGDGDAAAAHLDTALAITAATYGDASAPAMVVHHNLATTLGQLGRLDAAEVHAKRGLELARRLRGPDHLDTAKAILTIANIAGERRDYGAGEASAKEALAIVSAAFGAGHPMAASIVANLGAWALARGDAKAAEAYVRDALAAMGGVPENPHVAMMKTVLGDALNAQGKRADAIAELAAALAIRERIGDDPMMIADSQFTLARALWDAGEKDRALELARAAAATFRAAGEAAAPYVEAVDHWANRVKVSLASR